jgi:two-component sensor histidine kinase
MWRAPLVSLLEQPTHWWERVNARFALVLSLALLPLLVISLVQTYNLQEEARGRAQQAMLGATLRATSGEIGVNRSAQGAVAALASAPSLVKDSAQCAAAMRKTAEQVPAADLVAFVPASGVMTCSSDGSIYDYSASPQFKELIVSQTPQFTVVSRGPVTKTSILLVSHPVFAQSGTYLGYTTIALPHTKLIRVNEALDGSVTGLDDIAQFWTFNADGVMRGEASLEDTIHQKEVLLREVHHRVKNNLQLIASIMNIQMRKAVAPESKALLRSLQDRIMSLATIHRGLYQTSGMADVRVDELLRDIVRQIVNLGSSTDRNFDVQVIADEVNLTPDQAVPLSLLLTEAMANAMKYAGAGPDGKIRINVRFTGKPDQTAMIEVENTLALGVEERARADAVDGTGLGDQLITAFSQQLGGKLERTLSEGSYRLSVSFTVRSLSDAEARSE